MTRSHSRSAVTYKTWHNLRWWLLLTLFFLWVGWLSPWLRADAVSVLEQKLEQFAAGGPPANQIDWTHLWMVALGALPMTLERSRGALLTTLAGPVRRRDLYNIQCAWCVGAVWLGLVLLAVYIGIVNASLSGPLTVAQLLDWLWRQLLMHTAALTIGFAAGAIIGNYGMAVFCGFGVACVPVYASMVVGLIVNLSIQQQMAAHPHDAAWLAQYRSLGAVTEVLLRLSPLVSLYGVEGALLTALVLWFVLWSVGWYALGLWLFERLPLEREGGVFPYAACWHLLFVGIGLIVGLIVTGMSMPTSSNPPAAWQAIVLWLATSVVVWQLLALARRISARRRQE